MEQRIADLEQRVAALEASRPKTGASEQGFTPEIEDSFWALLELGRRNGRPAGNGSVMIVGDVSTPDDRVAKWQLEATTDDLIARDWDEFAHVFAALGNPVRLAILKAIITAQATTAKELGEALTANSTGQIYHHLKELTSAGWLTPTGNKGFTVPAGRLVPLLTTLLGGQR